MSMSKVRIITDSNAFLPPDVVKKYGIAVIPHRIKVGGSFFEEDADFSTEELFEKNARRAGHLACPKCRLNLNAFLDLPCLRDSVQVHTSSSLSPMWAIAQAALDASPSVDSQHLPRLLARMAA
jgi:fatty acid-binding protein DegV